MKRIIVCLVALVALVPQAGHARGGDIDRTFGLYGYAFANLGGYDTATALGFASDGKILVGGYVQKSGGQDFGVARFTSKGRPDPSFGKGGKATVGFGPEDTLVRIAGAPGGKVVAAGNSIRTGVSNNEWYQQSDFAIARFTSKGALDKTFSGDGRVTADIFGQNSDGEYLTALAVQPDSKIIVGGNTKIHHKIANPIGGTTIYEEDSKLIVLIRYAADGTLDPTFGSGGHLIMNFGTPTELAAVSVLKGGSILVAGTVWNTKEPPESDAFVLRLTSSGAPDHSFGLGGRMITDFGGSGDKVTSMNVGKDGKILIAGSTTRRYDVQPALARYSSAGSPDKSFSGDGMQSVKVGGTSGGIQHTAVQSDGKIVVVANGYLCRSFRFGNRTYRLCFPASVLARFTKTGSFDKTYGSGGTVFPPIPMSSFFTGAPAIGALAVQSDKALITGMFGGIGGADFGLMRLLK